MIADGERIGWTRGTIVDGTPSRNSKVAFTDTEWIVDRFRQIAIKCAPIIDVEIYPEHLKTVQLGRYKAPNEDYGKHIDHDTSRRNLKYDRKLSLVAALSDGGGLEIDDIGLIRLNAGDVLAFNSITDHAAPAMDHDRYTAVAWIPGPPWR